MDLSINIEEVRNVADYVSAKADNYDFYLDEFYNKFAELGNHWSGEDYNAANNVMTQNKNSLLELGKALHSVATALNAYASDYEAKIKASAAQFG